MMAGTKRPRGLRALKSVPQRATNRVASCGPLVALLSVACVALGCEAGDGGASALSEVTLQEGQAQHDSSPGRGRRGDGSTFSSGLDDALQINTLSTADINAFCAAEEAFVAALRARGDLCILAGINEVLSGTSQCEAVIEACEQSGGSDSDILFDSEESCGSLQYSLDPACTATVGEFEVCFNASWRERLTVFETWNCNTSFEDILEGMYPPMPPECSPLDDKGCLQRVD